jgi:hypothetical protein
MKNIRALFSLMALALGGCETIVEVDTPPHTPRLALTYTLSTQAPTAGYQASFPVRSLFVSSSQGVLDSRRLNGRGDATVQLLDETGQVVEHFRSKARYYGYNGQDSLYGNYVPVRNLTGEPGRTYTLRASAPGFETVESTLTLPSLPVIESAAYVAKQTQGGFGSYKGRLTMALTDNANTTDYYLAYSRVFDSNGRFWGLVRRSYDSNGVDGPDINLSLFQLSDARSLYNQHPFSDAGSNGRRLSFGADVALQYEGDYDPLNPVRPTPAYLEVVVSSITADTYRFYQSMLRYYDTDGNPFAEPAPLVSNVRPGYGLFGGATDATYRIPL